MLRSIYGKGTYAARSSSLIADQVLHRQSLAWTTQKCLIPVGEIP